MMIRRFERADLRSFFPNEHSDVASVMFVFEDPYWLNFSFMVDGVTSAIICARRYWGNNYVAFFLISRGFKARNAVKLREFLHSAHKRFGAKRIQTDSVACEKIDAWHRFMGFKLEGRREKMMHGKDYNCWAIVFGE